MKAAHNVLYMKKHTQTYVRFVSCDGHQLYDFKKRGVDLGSRGRAIYIYFLYYRCIAGRIRITYWVRLLQGAEISN